MLFAQRYQERDHTVFHRPAPPSAQKRQGAQPGNTAAAHHAATAATTTAHVRPAPLGNTQSGSDPHNPQPLTIPPSH